MTLLLWLRTVPSKVWLAVAASLLLLGWLHEHDRRVAERAVAASAMRASVQQRAHLREAVVEITIARDAALKAARDTADAYQIKAAFVNQRVALIRVQARALPNPVVTADGDSVTFSKAVWAQHVALDAQKDSALDDANAILRDGIPAIRNQYEAALAKDVKLFALKDSLVNNAEARVRLLTALKEGPRFVPHVGWGLACGVTVAGYRPQCVVGVTLGWGR